MRAGFGPNGNATTVPAQLWKNDSLNMLKEKLTIYEKRYRKEHTLYFHYSWLHVGPCIRYVSHNSLGWVKSWKNKTSVRIQIEMSKNYRNKLKSRRWETSWLIMMRQNIANNFHYFSSNLATRTWIVEHFRTY